MLMSVVQVHLSPPENKKIKKAPQVNDLRGFLLIRLPLALIPAFSQGEKVEFKIPHPFWLGL